MAKDYSDDDKKIVAFGLSQVEQLSGSNPGFLFLIARSKNLNIVVYESNLKDSAIVKDDPVQVYWLDIDPEYIKANRKKGITTDRSELNFIEKSMAYGIKGAASQVEGEYDVTLVPLPDRTFKLKLDADGKPQLITKIGGIDAVVSFVYVKSQERTFLPPKCVYVDLYGRSVADGAEVHERINP